jgi:hypothetical protein
LSGPAGKIVFILGAGRSGSTLLELILDSHSEIRGLGELNHLGRFATESGHQAPAACSYCPPSSCPFWNEAVDWAVLRRFYSRAGLAAGLRRSWYRRVGNPYLWFARWSGESILVDSSKNLLWLNRHLGHPRVWRDIEPALLFLTRDGRAVTNAVLRKHPHRTMDEAATEWKSRMLANEALFESFRLGRRLRTTYEQLATEPANAARRICQWLDLDYQPGMLEYWNHEHHMMAGNQWTRGRVKSFQDRTTAGHGGGASLEADTDAAKAGTRSNIGLGISPDQRWRTELSAGDLETFDRVAGAFNLRYKPDE